MLDIYYIHPNLYIRTSALRGLFCGPHFKVLLLDLGPEEFYSFILIYLFIEHHKCGIQQ